jgi:hypothetical protein
MKTKQEIEKLARIYENYNPNDSEIAQAESGGCYHGYKKGYTQCQEDNDELYHKGYLQGREDMAFELKDKKYTEEDIKKCWILATNYALNQSDINLRSFINSLNKQD